MLVKRIIYLQIKEILGWRHRYVPCHQAQFPAQEGCVPHHFSRELKEMQGPRGEGKVFLHNVCIMWKYLCILLYYPYVYRYTDILPIYYPYITHTNNILLIFSCGCRISERLNDSEEWPRQIRSIHSPCEVISSNQRWFQQHVQPLNSTCFYKCAHVKLKKNSWNLNRMWKPHLQHASASFFHMWACLKRCYCSMKNQNQIFSVGHQLD